MNQPRRSTTKVWPRRPAKEARRRIRPRIEVLEARQLLATVNWISTASGNWNVASNWSTGQVPGPSDDVVINVSGAQPTVTIDSGAVSVHSLTASDPLILTGGSLALASQSTINGDFNFSGGSLSPSGPLTLGGVTQWTGGGLTLNGQTVTNAGTLTMSSAGAFSLFGNGTLANTGTVNDQLGGGLNLDDATRLDNQTGGTFDFQVDSGIANDGGHGPGTFTNEGTLEKTVTTGVSTISINFVNSGAITVQTGTISLPASGGTSTGGAFTVAAGATLDLTGGNTVHYTGSYTGTGAGAIALGSGTMQLDGNTTFNFSGPSFQWTGGAINIPGGVTLTNLGAITIAGGSGGAHLFSGGTLSNQGTIDQTGSGGLFINDSITLDNTATGTYDFQADSGITNDSGHAAGTLTNEGTLEKTAGSGSSTISVGFVNSAAIGVQSGTITLANSNHGTSTGGSFTVAQGATLDLTGGQNVHYSGTYTGTGAGTILLQNGQIQLDGNTTFNFSGPSFQWTGGAINIPGGVTLTNLGAITIAGGSGGAHLFNGGTLSNQGAIDQTGSGGLFINDGITLDNTATGTYDFQADSNIANDGGHSPGTFTNEGTLEKTVTTGAGPSVIGVNFANSAGASISVSAGTLVLQTAGGLNTGGAFNVAPNASLDLTGGNSVNYTGTYTALGGGTILLAGGTFQVATTPQSSGVSLAFPGSMFQWTGGAINIPGGVTLTNLGAITIAGSGGAHLFNGGTLSNQGTIDQTGSGGLFINDSITLDNTATGTYDFQADSGITNDSGHAAGTLTNEGTLEKTAGSGSSTISVGFVNSAAIGVQSGTITLANSNHGTSTGGSFTVAQGATLDLTGGQNVHYSGTYTGTGAGTILLQNGQMQLDGNTTFNFSGPSFQWTGGAINIPGGVTLTNLGAITIAGGSGGAHLFNGGTLSNQGAIDQTGSGGLFINDGITLDNTATGTYDFQADSNIANDGGHSPGTFTNEGTLEKTVTAGTHSSVISVLFANRPGAAINVSAGTLDLQAAGGASSGGVFTVAQGAVLDLTGGATVHYTGSYTGTGAGAIALGSGTMQLDGNTTFNFSGPLFQWTGGNINIPGGVTLTNLGAITIAGSGGAHLFSGGTLSNHGTIDQSGTGGLFVNDSITLDNAAGAVYDFQAAASGITNDGGHSPGTLTNEGVIEWTGGTSTSTITIGIVNDGGSFHLAAGATLQLAGGSGMTLTGTFDGPGTVVMSSGTYAIGIGGVTFDVGNFEWDGGNINGALGDLTNLGIMTIAGSGEHMLYQDATLYDMGTIVQTGTGNLGLHSDSRFPTTLDIKPGGVYDITADSGIDNPFGGQTAVVNQGTIEKTGGTGTSTLAVNGTLDNSGTIEADSGTLALSATIGQVLGSTLSGGAWSALAGATLAFPSGTNITRNSANVTLAGQGASVTGIQGLASNQGSLTLTGGASFTTTGDLADGNASVGGGITLGPGSSLTVTGKYTQGPAATLDVQLGSAPAGGQFGQMTVTGSAALDGTLQSELVGGYVPKGGDSFPVIHFASSTGNFTVTNLPLFHGGNLFQVQTHPTSITLAAATSVAQLQVTSVTASPSPVQTGQNVTVDYTVRNAGNATAATSWVDSVFLSASGVIDSSAVLLGRVTHTGAVAASSSYSGSLTAAVPAILPGNYFVVVEADSRGAVPDVNRATTVLATASPVLVAVPTVTLGGSPVTGTMVVGQPVLLAIDNPTGEDFNISMPSSASGSGTLLVGFEAIPTDNAGGNVGFVPFQFDPQLGATTLRDQFQGGQAGTYYVLINWQGPASSASYSFSASAVGLSVDVPYPSAAPAANNVTLSIEGTGFTSSTRVSLVSGQTSIPADQVSVGSFDGNPFLTATFDLTTAPPANNYAVEVSDNSRTASTPATFSVFAAPSGTTVTTGQDNASIAASLEAPSAVRPGRVYSLTINYHSTDMVGSTVQAPILEISAANVEFQLPGQTGFTPGSIMLLGTNAPGQNNAVGIGSATQPADLPGTEELVPLWTQGAGGVLLPPTQFVPEYDGFSDSITVNFIASAAGAVQFNLGVAGSGTPVNWNSLQSQLQPPGVPATAWSAIFANFTAAVGNTMGGLQTALDNDANYLGQLGIFTSDVNRLLAFQLEQAGDFGAITQRYTPGIFGLGIPDPTLRAITDAQGNVEIVSGSTVRPFTIQPDGTYQGAPGDFASLTLANGIYQLRETNGTIEDFNANGSLNFIEDTNGNKTVYGYTRTQLTNITNTATGDVTSFTYNAQGLVNQATDPEGRITTLTYDAAGHLVSVTNPQGTTSYTYVTSGTPQQLNALASITNPDGSQVNFTYNSQGQLIGQSQNGGADPLTFGYDIGAITTTDALGNRSTAFLDDGEQVARTVDPLGNIIQGILNNQQEPASFTGPSGSSSISYDALDNPIRTINPLGQQTTATYNPTFDTLQSITDPRGNSLNYSYDPTNGNLLRVTYPDGSSQQYAYDATGNVTQFVNRAGQAIAYTYNSQGLLTTETFPDGSQDTFTYDSHRNLVSMTDSTGTTTFAYDSADRLTKVSYPDATFLEYTYNSAGQRIQMTDQTGFTVNYQYDALGRLSKLTDASANLIVSYSYDAAGRLSTEQFGNGTVCKYTYDADGNVLSIVNLAPGGSTQSSYLYTYNNQNLPITMTTAAGTFTYGYDGIGQLTSLQTPGGQTITYEYDAVGNRVAVVAGGATTQYTANNLNEYTQVGNTTYQYDANGNLISSTNSSGTTTYSYNVLGQLTGVVSPTGTTTYQYDALGSLVSETVNGQVTNNLIDPTGIGNVVAQTSGAGGVLADYTYGLGLVSQTSASGTSAYYSFDLSGNTTQLTGAGGSLLASYSYLPFGELISPTTTNPFTFAGQYGVMDEGNGLFYMRNRFYDSSLGRFTAPDPSGLAGGLNAYAYVDNRPTASVDPLGLWIVDLGFSGGDGLGVTGGVQIGSAGVFVYGGLGVTTPGVGVALQSNLNGNSPSVGTSVQGQVAAGPALAGIAGSYGTNFDKALNVVTSPVTALIFKDPSEISRSLDEAYNHPQSTGEVGVGIGFGSSRVTGAGAFVVNTVQVVDFGWPTPQDVLSNQVQNPAPAQIKALIRKGFKPVFLADGGIVLVVISHDPNAITGPAGFGSQGYLQPTGPFPYRVDFTNESTATAPAATVVVTQQLSPNLDLNTFQLGDIGFGSTTITVPAGLTSYSTQVTLPSTAPGAGPNGLIVQVSASLNLSTGLVTWTFTSLDPATMDIPINPFVGFLPPDNSKGDGEGFVSYTIQPKSGAASGTAINAQATVVFDTNAPISTKAIVNTIDVTVPTSSVSPLPATTAIPSFTVFWSGSDGAGSGIASYNVFVSDNGGPFQPFLTNTTATSATFPGQVGHTYAFYSVATSNVGLVQTTPSAAQATIAVVVPPVTVTSVHWATIQVKVGKGKRAKMKSETVLEVQFSGSLAGTGNLSAYHLSTVAHRKVKKHVVTTLKPIRLSSVLPASSPLTTSIALVPAAKPNVAQTDEIQITAADLIDALGRPLDGNGNGQPGGNATIVFGRGGVSLGNLVARAAVAIRPGAFRAAAVDHLLSREELLVKKRAVR